MNQPHHLGLGKDGALGVHGDLLVRFQGHRAQFLQGRLQGPGHGLDKGAGTGCTFFIDGKVHGVALLIQLGRPALLRTHVRDGPGIGEKIMGRLCHCFYIIYVFLNILDGVFPGTRTIGPFDLLLGNAGILQGRFPGGSDRLVLIKPGQDLSLSDNLAVFHDDGLGVLRTTVNSRCYHLSNLLHSPKQTG